MENQEIIDAFGGLWSDVDATQTFPVRRPLLAHYTSLATLEQIMRGNQLWFSNPLFMNDYEELRFGMTAGAVAFRSNQLTREKCGTNERYDILKSAFEKYYQEFEASHAFDTYVLCFSEHDPNDTDGLLSMWRGYGGNGNGAAIVIDSAQLNVVNTSPLVFSDVHYGTGDQRRAWLGRKIDEFAELMSTMALRDDQLPTAASMLLERIKYFALFTKHCGFKEEREWRAVYMSQRDRARRLKGMYDYSIGYLGIEPRLKFNIQPIDGVTAGDFSLEKLVVNIILGPTLSNTLAVNAVKRMLTTIGRASMVSKVVASTTPYRSG